MSLISRSSVVVGQSQPDMALARFTAILEAGSSPALPDASRSYYAIKTVGVSIAFATAIFLHESTLGKKGFATTNKNPGNTRTSTTGIGIPVTTVKGQFIRYPSWYEGFRDMAWRLVKPDYIYALEGRKTIEQIIYKWAPPEDGNDTEGYINTVVTSMNEWIGGTEMSGIAVPEPDITWIGSTNYWVGRWSEDVLGICDHIMQGTLKGTDGYFNSQKSGVSSTFGVGLAGAIHQYVSLSDSAWANGIVKEPDLGVKWLADFVNRGDNPNHCTVSIEHEGFTGDPMPETQYQATLALHKWLLAQFPKITVDRQGIIGHYQIDLPDKENCPGTGFPWTRLIADLVAWKNAGGGKVTMPDNIIVLNGHQLGHGFLDYFNQHGGVRFFGLPITEEQVNPVTGCTEQAFERYVLEYDPKETNPDWKVRGKIVGPVYLKARGF